MNSALTCQYTSLVVVGQGWPTTAVCGRAADSLRTQCARNGGGWRFRPPRMASYRPSLTSPTSVWTVGEGHAGSTTSRCSRASAAGDAGEPAAAPADGDGGGGR